MEADFCHLATLQIYRNADLGLWECIEIKPRCGTCRRRRHECQGYAPTRGTLASLNPSTTSPSRQARRDSAVLGDANRSDSSSDVGKADVCSGTPEDDSRATSLAKHPFSRFNEPMTTEFSSSTVPRAGHPLIMDPGMMTPRALGLIPPGVVSPSDQAPVEVYFIRHPWELSMGSEFVSEMNANVLTVLHHNPQAIVDSLSAIGHSYLADNSLAVLNYRARILATLRSMDVSKYTLEEMIFMLLGLCAIELIDCRSSTAAETTIPAIIANSAALIHHHVSMGRELSSLARYFIRALARQGMVLSLVHLHRPLISTAVWLDEEAKTLADRLMGYTATFMPLLEELCHLAEGMRGLLLQLSDRDQQKPNTHSGGAMGSGSGYEAIESWVTQGGSCHVSLVQHMEQVLGNEKSSASNNHIFEPAPVEHPQASASGASQLSTDFADYAHRADNLRVRIELWKPNLPHGLSFRKSRRFLSQAASYRAGALLYLFRLLNPPSRDSNNAPLQSSTVDEEATAMAHEVLMSTNSATNNPDEVKMLLWPVFLAACEMFAEEDRQMVLDVLDTIQSQRKTVTVKKTKGFILDRVWPARDQGREWNWMVLAQKYSGECLPI